jgi:nucleoside-diphosphate-sugar epimerase
MNKVIITGPTGAIGIALIQQLIDAGIEVWAVCRRGSARMGNLPKHALVHPVELNLSELSELPNIIPEMCDTFYHLGWDGTFGGARDDMQIQLQNIRYTLDAVEVAKQMGCKRFIGAGSQAEYGRTDARLNADTPTFPENGYGIAKLCAGQMSRIRCVQLGMEHIWTRILSVYGPYDGRNTMVMSVIRKLLNGETPDLTGGAQIWDYLYTKDAGCAMMLLGECGISGRTYCIGSGHAAPLRTYIDTMRNAINPELLINYGAIPYDAKQVMHLCADITDLVRDTGFQVQYSFEDGIRETIDWVRKNEENQYNDPLLQ